jgi:putative transposase
MDFAEAPRPIDGLDGYLLAVRDLASGQQLLWRPAPAATAEVVIGELAALFAAHGPPLVLKTDNGSAFGADAWLDFLKQHGVLALFSPPGTPRYNGAIEAGIGSLKARTQTHALRQGRAQHWSADDVAAAQAEANASARPQGPAGPTPEQRWALRPTLSPDQRLLFQAAVERHRQEALRQQDLPTHDRLETYEARAIDRQAIRRALVEHGYLLFARRRIPLPFSKRKKAGIR